ncbi:SCO2400 family protein [Streptomyces acidiscabies]|uniref:Uncharacterized protein n=1 Tax=Streptomyces acidiscabies TaxID=42234 RepID=A0A0L0JC69_9ACTN|nr:hypothetical protein [Streptomyces acidiscabies]KND23322.1 hypothetical protein IQ63_44730 [Streptomyces acidiscabies]
MDYCSTCRRHLNGALVCPGCGAYAPDIAPLPGGAPASIASSTAVQVQHAFPAETPHDISHDASYEVDPAETAYDADTPYDAAAATPDGRAARRRQRERWKKTQRRALVATAVALVGGGLTVASMNRQTPARTQAASAPDRETMGVAEEEITQYTPGTTASDPQRATPGTTPGRSSAASGTAGASGHSAPTVQTPNTPREQSAAQPQGAQANQRQAAPSSPTPSTGSQGTATTPGTSGTATEPTPAPSPSPSGGSTSGGDTSGSGASGSGASGSGTSGSGTSGSGTSGSGTSSDATNPAGLCLLGLVCIT